MNCGFAPDHCRKRQQTERRQGTVLRLLSPSRGDEEPSPVSGSCLRSSPVSAQRDSDLNQPINSGKEIDNIHNQLKVWQPRPQLRADSDRQSAREDQCDHCGNQGGCK